MGEEEGGLETVSMARGWVMSREGERFSIFCIGTLA